MALCSKHDNAQKSLGVFALNVDEAMAQCDSLGLHPLYDPMGDEHHTDAPFSDEDKKLGDALAYFLGTLFADVQGEHSRYWYYDRTSVDEWSRVARALRIHGLRFADRHMDSVNEHKPQPVKTIEKSGNHMTKTAQSQSKDAQKRDGMRTLKRPVIRRGKKSHD